MPDPMPSSSTVVMVDIEDDDIVPPPKAFLIADMSCRICFRSSRRVFILASISLRLASLAILWGLAGEWGSGHETWRKKEPLLPSQLVGLSGWAALAAAAAAFL